MVDVAGAVLGLHSVNLGSKMDVVAEEVYGFAGTVNLGLVDVLALAQHAGCIEDGTILGGKQFRAFEDDGRACGPRGLGPNLVGLHCGINCHLDFLLAYFVESCEDMLVVMGADHLAGISRTDFLAADDDGDVQHGVVLALQFFIQCDALRRAFKIGFHRFVGRYGEVDDCVVHI